MGLSPLVHCRRVDCVWCGSNPGLEKAGYLCEECLRKRSTPAPPAGLAVVVCIECGKAKRGPEWTGNLRWAVELLARKACSNAGAKLLSAEPDLDPSGPTTGVAHIRLEMPLDSGGRGALPTGFEYEWKVPLKVAQGLCADCGRKRGGYWEAIIQLRSDDIEDEHHPIVVDVLGRIAAGKDRNSFVAKVDEVRGGVDIYLGSWRLADRIAHEISSRTGAEVKLSRKLHTHADGRNIYRSTLLVRFPDVMVGDAFCFEERAYRLLGLLKKGVRARDLLTGDNVPLEVRLASLDPAARSGDVRSAVAISESKGEMEVLDPESYEPVTLEVPKTRAAADGPAGRSGSKRARRSFAPQEVKVIRIDGRLYLYE
ncbi:MAG TPA: NMD3-related protein [Thermoplasmata archaeon]|nr:NMD3-related protein [Thermoplasmata archaeon]